MLIWDLLQKHELSQFHLKWLTSQLLNINHHNDITVMNPNEFVFYIFHIKTINFLIQVSILWDFNKFYSVFNIWNEFTALSVGFGVYWRIADILCLPLFVGFVHLLHQSHFRTSRTQHSIAKSLTRLLVTGSAYSLHLFVLPHAHMLNLWGVNMPMADCTEILSFLWLHLGW